VLEIKVAFSMSSETANGTGEQATFRTKSTPVDATYANRFQYPVEGSSVLRTKLVTVPPPGLLEGRVRELVQAEQRQSPGTPA
jgi:hypothetical protein